VAALANEPARLISALHVSSPYPPDLSRGSDPSRPRSQPKSSGGGEGSGPRHPGTVTVNIPDTGWCHPAAELAGIAGAYRVAPTPSQSSRDLMTAGWREAINSVRDGSRVLDSLPQQDGQSVCVPLTGAWRRRLRSPAG
jgi:hypothetical protein